MRNVTVILSSMAFMASLSHAVWAADCSHVGDNAIADANVANLQQDAATAEERAATAPTADQRQRWEDAARSLNMQAQAAQTRDSSLSNLAEQACDTLLNNNNDNDGDNDNNN